MPKLLNEWELEEYIISTMENGDSNPAVWENFPDLIFSQVNLGGYGIVDIITVDFNPTLVLPNNVTEIHFTIMELKKEIIDLSTIAQICRYKQGLFNYFKHENRIIIKISGVLVGNKINAEDGSCYVIDSMGWLHYVEYDISLNRGISFVRRENWYKEDNNYNCLDKLIQQSKHIFLDIHKSFLREAYKYV